MSVSSAGKEHRKLLQAKQLLRPKRGYLVYVARYGDTRAMRGPKGKGGYYFFEIPIVLTQTMTKAEVQDWSKMFRLWSKYVVKQV